MDKWISEKKENKLEFEDLIELWRKTGNFSFPEKIDGETALKQIHIKAGIHKTRRLNFRLVAQIAAVLLLSILFSGTYSYFNSRNSQSSDNSYTQQVCAAFGTRTNIDLPDGTTVYLNSGSSLRFSSDLGKTNTRYVELKGEGYFEVAKDEKRPFIVKTARLDVKVVGTTFNVNAYSPEEEIKVALVEGKVILANATNGKSKDLMILNASELAHFETDANKISKSTDVDMERYIGWIHGKIIFVDDPIREVVKRLENSYNVDITLKDQQLNSYRYTGTFINETLDEILNVLSLTSPLDYKIEAPAKNDTGEYSKRKILLRKK